MEGAAHQRDAGTVGLERMARVAHVFVAEPVADHDDHRIGRRRGLAQFHLQCAAQVQARQHLAHGLLLGREQALEMRLEPAVLEQQVVQVAVQEAVLPDQLEQHVKEQPGILDMAHVVRRGEQLAELGLVAAEQRVDQLVLGGEVVVEVAGADLQLGRDQRRGDIRLAEGIEEVERDLQDALGGAAGAFGRGHGGSAQAPATTGMPPQEALRGVRGAQQRSVHSGSERRAGEATPRIARHAVSRPLRCHRV
mmetsp:Transcript_6313/g.25614  ORF Transcript_6313/g.25614 Transcript_6313/m.25614 type:complete len:251 (-) Transcript_6313:2165-2917(-)